MNLQAMGLGAAASAALSAAGLLNANDIAAHSEVSLLALVDDVAILDEIKLVLEVMDMKLAAEREAEAPHPFLSADEVLEVRKGAEAELLKERKTKAKDELKKIEKQRLREEMGLYVGGPADESVTIYMNLAEHSQYVTLNTKRYFHGYTYKVPRHVASTLAEIQSRGHKHQDEIDGKSLTQHYQRNRDTTLSPVRGISGQPQRAA